ncbi:unnamed protein product [Meganyctiphanes norvegica]|uniref:Uncharacterized protein n=1 Tax=Meganyctiphanes norvegica TaxID=48144 RepID=A0AAV2RW40_MEGNR
MDYRVTLLLVLYCLRGAAAGPTCYWCSTDPGDYNYDEACGDPNYDGHTKTVGPTQFMKGCATTVSNDGYVFRGFEAEDDGYVFRGFEAEGNTHPFCSTYSGMRTCWCNMDECNSNLCEQCTDSPPPSQHQSNKDNYVSCYACTNDPTATGIYDPPYEPGCAEDPQFILGHDHYLGGCYTEIHSDGIVVKSGIQGIYDGGDLCYLDSDDPGCSCYGRELCNKGLCEYCDH